MADPLYRRILGARYDVLPPVIQEMHDVDGALTAKGRGARPAGNGISQPPGGNRIGLSQNRR